MASADKFSTGLVPCQVHQNDDARQIVRADLDPNCLPLMAFLKKVDFEKKNRRQSKKITSKQMVKDFPQHTVRTLTRRGKKGTLKFIVFKGSANYIGIHA